jgi:hypothetical protein
LSATVIETRRVPVPIPSRLAPALAFLASFGLASAAGAIDLTGTWEGSYTCQGFDGINFKTGNKTSVLLISQEGTQFSADLDGGDYIYNGVAIDDEKDPQGKGNLVMNQCGTDSFPTEGPEGEIVRMSAKVNTEKGTGALKGVGIVEFTDETRPTVVTCKFKFKRVNTTPADFTGCPTL